MSRQFPGRVALNNGVSIPQLGLGLYNIADGPAVEAVVESALAAGYRGFDNATLYGNEPGVGRALAAGGVAREELFITSKAWNSEQGYQETLDAFARSLDRLGLDYLDLYLLHWPVPGRFAESWRALERLYADGRVRAIGVSNFHEQQLDTLLAAAEVVPAVNQVELHPRLRQVGLHRYCLAHGIRIQAWSPLQHGRILGHPVLGELGEKYGRSPAQIVLRHLLQQDIVAVAKAANPRHLRENLDILDFELSAFDVARIDILNREERIGPDPDTVDYTSDEEFIRIFRGWEVPVAAAA